MRTAFLTSWPTGAALYHAWVRRDECSAAGQGLRRHRHRSIRSAPCSLKLRQFALRAQRARPVAAGAQGQATEQGLRCRIDHRARHFSRSHHGTHRSRARSRAQTGVRVDGTRCARRCRPRSGAGGAGSASGFDANGATSWLTASTNPRGPLGSVVQLNAGSPLPASRGPVIRPPPCPERRGSPPGYHDRAGPVGLDLACDLVVRQRLARAQAHSRLATTTSIRPQAQTHAHHLADGRHVGHVQHGTRKRSP